MAVATIWIAIGTLGLVILNSFMLLESSREFYVSHRPWLNIECKSNGPITIDSSGFHTSISYSIKNGGTAPAVRAIDYCSGLHVDDGDHLVQAEDCMAKYNEGSIGFEGIKERVKERPKNVLGFLLLPGEITQTKNFDLNVPLHYNKEAGIFISYTLGVCYQDDLGKVHQTSILWKFVPDKTNADLIYLSEGSRIFPGKFEQETYHEITN